MKRRGRPGKPSHKIAELYRQAQCRECYVDVTRLDFKKLLGNFTKVKVQFEPTLPELKSKSKPKKKLVERTKPKAVHLLKSAQKIKLVKKSVPKSGRVQKSKSVQKLGRTEKIKSLPKLGRIEKFKSVPKSGHVEKLKSVQKPKPVEKLKSVQKQKLVEKSKPIDKLKSILKIKSLEKSEHIEKAKPAPKVTSPRTAARLRNKENGMVLIPRAAYKEHPVMDKLTPPASTPRRGRGRPPKYRPPLVENRYRIIFNERRHSFDSPSAPDDINIANLLPLNDDVLPTEDWFIDYQLQEEPKNDRVYDRIAAQLEDLMCEGEAKEGKTEDFPTIMDLLGDPEDKDKPSNSPQTENTEQKDSKSADAEPKVNGKTDTVDVDTITYVLFKRMKNEECTRLVKCSKNLIYSVEIDNRPVELVGAPKYISSVDDLRLLLQIVDESSLESFNVVQGG